MMNTPKDETMSPEDLIGRIEAAQKMAVDDYNRMGEKFGSEDQAELIPAKIVYKKKRKEK